jgi:hypothetical protein
MQVYYDGPPYANVYQLNKALEMEPVHDFLFNQNCYVHYSNKRIVAVILLNLNAGTG